jgi:hypothetical protein
MLPVGIGSLFGTWDESGSAPVITFKPRGGSSAARKLQAIKCDWKIDSVINDLNNGNGTPSGFNKVRSVVTFSVELVIRCPVATGALAATRTEFMPPDELTVVTFANFVSASHTLMNGDFVYRTGAQCGTTDEGEAVMKFDVMQYYNGAGTLIPAANLVATVA